MTTEERLAIVETKLGTALAAVERMEGKLEDLTAAMHRGRGALAAMLTIAGLMGAGLASALASLFGKG